MERVDLKSWPLTEICRLLQLLKHGRKTYGFKILTQLAAHPVRILVEIV
jgi:hypothetical protein